MGASSKNSTDNLKLPLPKDYAALEERPDDPENCHKFLKEKLDTLPACPGVYLMRDKRRRVIYVGKSACLKNRVRSYFHSHTLSARIKNMVSMVRNFDIITVETEMEALLLENNLIKKYRPYFNVLFRDDKQYPSLELTTFEAYPRLRIIRSRTGKSKGILFGPYANGIDLKRAKAAVQKLFKIRPCSEKLLKPKDRPCLYFHTGSCSAPCLKGADSEQYSKQIEMAREFLSGRTKNLIKELKLQMQHEAKLLNYEKCALLRDTIKNIQLLEEKQQIVFNSDTDADYISIVSDLQNNLSCAVLRQVREGRLQGQHSFILNTRLDEAPQNTLSLFIRQYYSESMQAPENIYTEYLPESCALLSEWLSSLRGRKISISVPAAGKNINILKQAQENASRNLQDEMHAPSRQKVRAEALKELQQALSLSSLPVRMECYDISNIQGKYAVGSMTVFENGLPHRSHYRKFKIIGMDTPNDFAMMRQVLMRRLCRLESVKHSKEAAAFRKEMAAAGQDFKDKDDISLSTVPDLIIVDGGLGQLGAADDILHYLHLHDKIRLAGLAKRLEELFTPEKKLSVMLPESSQAYSMVTHLRNEAHRFAITFHRKLRGKAMIHSALEEIPGIGPKLLKSLRTVFGTSDKLKEASAEALQKVPGIGPKLAKKIFAALHSQEVN